MSHGGKPATKAERVQPRRWHVYVAAEMDCSPRYVKIGISGNPARRFMGRCTDNPREVRIVVAEPVGNKDAAIRVERALHYRFAPWFKWGEWFGEGIADTDAFVAAIVADLRAMLASKTEIKKLPRHWAPVEINPDAPQWWLLREAA